jgi:hypothetical protein
VVVSVIGRLPRQDVRPPIALPAARLVAVAAGREASLMNVEDRRALRDEVADTWNEHDCHVGILDDFDELALLDPVQHAAGADTICSGASSGSSGRDPPSPSTAKVATNTPIASWLGRSRRIVRSTLGVNWPIANWTTTIVIVKTRPVSVTLDAATVVRIASAGSGSPESVLDYARPDQLAPVISKARAPS